MEQNSFITNQDKLLSDIINGILPKSKSVDILVGYFYYSGFDLISEKLKDKEVRILVGLDIDTKISNELKEYYSLKDRNLSRGQIKDNYYNSFVSLYNDTDHFDNKNKQKSFELFYNKILNGSLEIRKTQDPCHAKMYLFEYNDIVNEGGEDPGTVITGSSNLSYGGLSGRLEINARFNDINSYSNGKQIFNQLWDNSIVIVDKNNIDEFKTKVIKNIWYEKLYSPYLMYIRVLNEYFTVSTDENILTPYDITNGTFYNLKYQTDAVQMAIKAISIHSGVIISDVVGLGKSIIASTVARNLKLRTIVICPPHLIPQWEEYRDQFKFTASIFSSGQIKAALDHYLQIKESDEKFLIIIDEAHKYRNEYTQDYSLLHDLCMDNKVILLTATPFNNRPEDIYSMIKLFQIPSKSTLKTVDNLGAAFKDLIAKYKELYEAQRLKKISEADVKTEADKIAKRIRSIIMPLVIRRTRLDLNEIPEYKKDLKSQNIKLVIPEDPISLEYNLGDMRDLYLKTLNKISPSYEDKERNKNISSFEYFKAARYQPSAYFIENEEERVKMAKELEDKTGVKFNMLIGRQANISSFMRKMLVRRFESSVAAFRESLNYMIYSSEHVLSWIDKRGKVPIYKRGSLPDVEDFYQTSDDNQFSELTEVFEKYENKGFFEIDMKYITDNYVNDIKADIKLLKGIRNEWFGESQINSSKQKKNIEAFHIRFDYKLDAFKKVLKEKRISDPQRKIIVFTEYADTANYIGKILKDEGFGVLKYTSADASENNKDAIRANFDAGLKAEMQRDDYQILIATDAISEGYNLHRAGTIFNYDIPYNPTRVIQRIGRINRVNKKMFDKLYIYNYFPTDVGEKETRTKEISTLKMAMVNAIMGEDTKALTSEEELNAFFKERYKKELVNNEERSWDNVYRNELNQLKGTDIYKEALAIPHRTKIGRHCVDKPRKGVILFGKKGDDYVFKISDEEECLPISLTAEDALSLFQADKLEKPLTVSNNFDSIYQQVKQKLFKNDIKDDKEKQRLEANRKIIFWIKQKELDKDYLSDLLTVLRNGGLTGDEIRFINKLTLSNINMLPKKITQEYINRVINKMNKVEEGDEVLILAEELI